MSASAPRMAHGALVNFATRTLAVGLGMGITLAGPAAFQLRRLAYLARMPGLQHQLRVAGGWLADWF